MTCRRRRNVNYFEGFVTYGTVIYYLPEMENDRCNYWQRNLFRSSKRLRVELERTRRIREDSFANKFIDWHTKGQKRAPSAPYLSRWTFASPLRRCTSPEKRIEPRAHELDGTSNEWRHSTSHPPLYSRLLHACACVYTRTRLPYIRVVR